MDDLAFLRERIESYADYTNAAFPQLSDEQIRAYVGVAITGIFERLAPTGAAGEALAALLLRCQFADQRVAHALDAGDASAGEIGAIHDADRTLVALADRAATIDEAGLLPFAAEIGAALDRRAELLISGAAAAGVTPPREPR